jgi:phosphoglycolate/pyridoxal phosphate phosphatase family enzyme
MRKESEAELAKLAHHYEDRARNDPAFADLAPIIWKTLDEATAFVNDHIETIMFDCDGVVYRTPDECPGAKECIQRLLDKGKRVFFVTNNAASNRSQLRAKLSEILAIENLTDDMMVPSSYSCARFLQREILDRKGRGRLFVIGSRGLCDELEQTGFEVLTGNGPLDSDASMTREDLATYPFSEHPVDAVVVGHDTALSFRKICIANVLLQMNPDAPLVATNKDAFDLVGVDGRHIPGNGCAVVALEHSSKRTAINVGKPSATLADLIAADHGINPSRTMFVGDRLDTDIQFGVENGMHSVLVMTGVTTADSMVQLGNGTNDEPLPNIVIPHIGLLY